jgi:hypothetical protein
MHNADRDGLWGHDRLGGPLKPPPHELAQEGSDRGAGIEQHVGHTHSLHHIRSHLLAPGSRPVTTAAAALQGTNTPERPPASQVQETDGVALWCLCGS